MVRKHDPQEGEKKSRGNHVLKLSWGCEGRDSTRINFTPLHVLFSEYLHHEDGWGRSIPVLLAENPKGGRYVTILQKTPPIVPNIYTAIYTQMGTSTKE